MHKTCTLILTSDGPGAADALLGEEFTKAIGTVRLLVTRSELLSCQHLVTVGACEAFAVPRCSLVGDTTFVDHLWVET